MQCNEEHPQDLAWEEHVATPEERAPSATAYVEMVVSPVGDTVLVAVGTEGADDRAADGVVDDPSVYRRGFDRARQAVAYEARGVPWPKGDRIRGSDAGQPDYELGWSAGWDCQVRRLLEKRKRIPTGNRKVRNLQNRDTNKLFRAEKGQQGPAAGGAHPAQQPAAGGTHPAQQPSPQQPSRHAPPTPHRRFVGWQRQQLVPGHLHTRRK